MDLEAKRKLLRKIPSGLYVVGVRADKESHAFTGSWLTQISMKPPCILLGIREDTRSFEMVKKGRVLTVNYIRKENKKTIEHFFKPVSGNGDRLGGYPFHEGKTGAPILEEAIAYLECEVRAITEGFGDHSGVIAEVVEAVIKEDMDPLVMSDTPWHYGG